MLFELGGLRLIDRRFEHAVFLEVARHAVLRDHALDLIDAEETGIERLAAELRPRRLDVMQQAGEARIAEATVTPAGAVAATGTFEQHDLLGGEGSAQMLGGGESGE